MKKTLFITVLVFFTLNLKGQKYIRTTSIAKTIKNDLSKKFKAYQIVKLPIDEINTFVKERKNGFTNLTLNFPSQTTFNLEIYPYNITTPDYQVTVVTATERKVYKPQETITYRGSLKNTPNSKVYLTITEGTFFGTIFDGFREYMIELLTYLKSDNENTDAFVFFVII